MTTTLTTPTMSGQEIVDLCKKHTLYEWSAQSKVDPIPVARAKGIYFYTPEGAHAAYCKAAAEHHGEFARTA